jgi:hypothetical protein
MPSYRPAFGALCLVALAALFAACGDGATAPPRATALTLVTSPSEVAEVSVPLPIQPVVQVSDEKGRPISAAATVTARVVSGSGAVIGGGTVTTSASGLATFTNLTLGAVSGAVGPVTIEFGAPGLTAATAQTELRCATLHLALSQPVTRELTTADCRFGGGLFANVFDLRTTLPVTAVRVTETGTFAPTVDIRGANEPAYFWGWTADVGATVNHLAYKALLPSGRHFVAVMTSEAGRTGTYTLTLTPESEDLTCEPLAAWVASPVTTTQHLGITDCFDGSVYFDEMLIGLPQHASIRVTMTSSDVQPVIELVNGYTNTIVASATAVGAASLDFTNGDQAIPFFITMSGTAAATSGAYTVAVNVTYPTSAALVASGASHSMRPIMRVPSARAARTRDAEAFTSHAVRAWPR